MAQINSSNSFQPERRIAVPKVDVVSWTFATYGDYDVDRPVRRALVEQFPLAKATGPGDLHMGSLGC